MIEIGIKEGVMLFVGGLGCFEGLNKGYFVCFMVFVDVMFDMMIYCEEIFGLVFVIMLFDLEVEVIEMVNDMVYGLINYI